MSFADPNEISSEFLADEPKSKIERLWHWVAIKWLPAQGWAIFLATLLLTTLPMQAAKENEWIVLGDYSSNLTPVGPLGVLLIWIIMGWKRDRVWADSLLGSGRTSSPSYRLRLAAITILILGISILVLSQALVGWIPGPLRLLSALNSGSMGSLWAESSAGLSTIATRLIRWWSGVLAGGATQDDLVFAAIAGLVAWGNGILTGYLVRRRFSGFFCGLPSLWLLMTTLLYGTVGRMIFVAGLLITLLIHVLMDQLRLTDEWDKSKISYGDGLIIDRLQAALAASLIIFGVASLTPNLRLSGLADRYLQLYQPLNDQVEGFGQRLFPDMKVTSRFRGGALSNGLPNSFLLGAGPELSQTEVMRYRTDDPIVFEPDILEEVPARGHYIRGGSLSVYDGQGWDNPLGIERIQLEADAYVPNLRLLEPLTFVDSSPDVPRGRRLLTQDIFLSFNSRGLYGAAEPLSFSQSYRLEQRYPGDQTSFWTGTAGGESSGTSSYTVVSAIPDVNEAALTAEASLLPDDEDPLWNVLSHHLSLPDTVTARTRDLAAELTNGLDNPYAKATAIETYLREFEYDLSVAAPPADIEDVADYFLFDLQRGYCDYYATAFIVLARLSGLPARFSTGFVPGTWNGVEGMWVITEAEAHSWPEVYFPKYGWIPFEPTAGRSALSRVGVGPETGSSLPAPVITAPEVIAPTETSSTWNWQILFWLLPAGALLWGAYRLLLWWRHKQEDPWISILRWGQRIGRPIQGGETVLEYGNLLSEFVLERYQYRNQDMGRTVAREISSLSEQLSIAQYGTEEQRHSATQFIEQQWTLLRTYIASL